MVTAPREFRDGAFRTLRDTPGFQHFDERVIEAFNRACRDSVFTYKEEWERLSERIGYWLDYSRPYVTYTNEYIESVWWLLKQLHEGWTLYQGHKVLPYCPRFGTALSSHELAQGYDTHRSPSIHVLTMSTRFLAVRQMALMWDAAW